MQVMCHTCRGPFLGWKLGIFLPTGCIIATSTKENTESPPLSMQKPSSPKVPSSCLCSPVGSFLLSLSPYLHYHLLSLCLYILFVRTQTPLDNSLRRGSRNSWSSRWHTYPWLCPKQE